MSEPNASLNPHNDDASGSRAGLSPFIFLKTAIKEWIPSLLDQPAQPPFKLNAQFRDESARVARLLTVSLIVSIATIGGLSIFGRFDVRALLTQAFTVIIACLLVAFAYRPFAYICGVRLVPPDESQQKPRESLSSRQIAFAVLYIFVPWIPIFVFVRTEAVATHDPFQNLLLIAQFICFGYVIFNFAKAIRLITSCQRYRIWLSIVLPILITGIILIKLI